MLHSLFDVHVCAFFLWWNDMLLFQNYFVVFLLRWPQSNAFYFLFDLFSKNQVNASFFRWQKAHRHVFQCFSSCLFNIRFSSSMTTEFFGNVSHRWISTSLSTKPRESCNLLHAHETHCLLNFFVCVWLGMCLFVWTSLEFRNSADVIENDWHDLSSYYQHRS